MYLSFSDNKNMILLFSYLYSLFFFFSLIILIKNSSTLLHSKKQRVYPLLFLILVESLKVFFFTCCVLGIVFATGLMCNVFVFLNYVLYVVFVRKCCWVILKIFSASNKRIVGFVFDSVYLVD